MRVEVDFQVGVVLCSIEAVLWPGKDGLSVEAAQDLVDGRREQRGHLVEVGEHTDLLECQSDRLVLLRAQEEAPEQLRRADRILVSSPLGPDSGRQPHVGNQVERLAVGRLARQQRVPGRRAAGWGGRGGEGARRQPAAPLGVGPRRTAASSESSAQLRETQRTARSTPASVWEAGAGRGS